MGMAVSVPRYTVDDLERFPDDGNRYELLDGVLLVTPAPRFAHQVLATRLVVQLSSALEDTTRAVVVGPGAIVAPPGTQLQPDVLVCPARFGAEVRWTDITEHWLAIEILSHSSRIYDRDFKRAAYFALGVPQVWLVDIADRSVDVWTSRDEDVVEREVVRWRVPTSDLEVTIDLRDLFAGVA